MDILYFGARFYLWLRGVKVKTNNKIGKPEEPSIILCNHGSFMDFIYAALNENFVDQMEIAKKNLKNAVIALFFIFAGTELADICVSMMANTLGM